MDSRKFVFQETAVVAIGQVVCVSAMCGIFALLSKFDRTVLLGGIVGGLLAVLNFLFMAIGASLARRFGAAAGFRPSDHHSRRIFQKAR